MGIITRGFERIANSRTGTKFFKWAESKKGQDFLNNSLPTGETLLATSLYTVAVERQDLDRRRKNLLHIQNWVPAVIGMGIGTYLNRQVSKFGDAIIKHLDPKQVKNMHKIVNATKVMLPILMTGFLMRFLSPTVVAYASGEIEAKKAAMKKKEHLDIQA